MSNTQVSIGFDPGLERHTWCGVCPTGPYATGKVAPVQPNLHALTWPDVVVIERPTAQGYERVYARLLERYELLLASVRLYWSDVPVYAISSNELRYKVCGWVPRRDGHADPAVRSFLIDKAGYGVYCQRGGILNSEDKRDAAVAALWGQAVLQGKIEQPERWRV